MAECQARSPSSPVALEHLCHAVRHRKVREELCPVIENAILADGADHWSLCGMVNEPEEMTLPRGSGSRSDAGRGVGRPTASWREAKTQDAKGAIGIV